MRAFHEVSSASALPPPFWVALRGLWEMRTTAVRAAALVLLSAACCLGQRTPVILISIDTLRADHLSAYGYRTMRTPNIDSFAQHGTVFTSIDSQIPLTLPSHTSLFTSTYPFANGVEENDGRVPAGAVTLASVLHAHGYKTAAFVGSVLLDRRTGISLGFDSYDSPFHMPQGGDENPYAVRVRRDGALVARAARQWLEANRGQPAFVFLHFFDLHTPYSLAPAAGPVPETSGYDAELAYLDRLLGSFRQALAAGGWWDQSLVVLLSDHGESLGDHGEMSHGYFIYQSTLHVPLIIHWPSGFSNYGERTTQPGGLIDVAPTILDFLGIQRPPSFVGQSLLANTNHAVYSESTYTRDAFQWAPLRSLRSGKLEYIEAPKPELYNLESDRGEQHNIVAANAGEGKTLREQLSNLLQRFSPMVRQRNATSTRTNAVLGSLGYLGHGSRSGKNRPEPDPKDKLPEYNLFEKALASLYTERPQAAIQDFRQILRQDPENTLARYYLGDAYWRTRQPDSAVREWTAAVRLDPEYVPAEESLARVWMDRKDYTRARGYFQQVLAAAPDDSAALLGISIAEKHLGLLPEARKHWEAACTLDPESTECRRAP